MGSPKWLSDFISGIESVPEKIVILNRLQDERKQIELFKRELPLCISVVDQAIAALQDEISKSFQDLHDCINFLQDEKEKIEAFKHKFPRYLSLLSAAIAEAQDKLTLYNKYNSGDYELSSKMKGGEIKDQILETCSSSSSC